MWSPYSVEHINKIELVQRHAALPSSVVDRHTLDQFKRIQLSLHMICTNIRVAQVLYTVTCVLHLN